MVAEELAKENPGQISNWHMAFDEIKLPDGSAEITFLYKLSRGLAEASFGIWCARLAGLPKSVLQLAQERADHLKVETEERMLSAVTHRSSLLLTDLSSRGTGRSTTAILHNAQLLSKAFDLVR